MCSRCNWAEVLEEIEEMCADSDYEFAAETLEGIYEWVEENGHVTEGQETAVGNIKESVQ